MSEDSYANPPPVHVAIIMDGNGRWARQRNKPRIEGHRKGVENLRTVIKAASESGVNYLTVYAFSSENWNRPKSEVKALMELLENFLGKYTKELLKNRIRLKTIGDISVLPPKALAKVREAIEKTKHFEENTLVLALNYGGRQETMRAATLLARDIADGKIDGENMNWETFREYLYTNDIPDPELLIRTSGEMRISNFLPLQCAYSELVFSPLYWPDFGKDAFNDAIRQYRTRERRFGMTGEQLKEEMASR